MVGSQNSSIVKGFIDEVRTYIPLIYGGIDTLRSAPDSSDVIEELYRLVHIIHGAASLVGLPGLSHTASQVEDTLEEVMAGEVSVEESLLDAMSTAAGCFEAYSKGEVTCRDDEVRILTETVSLFRRVRGLPESGDEEVLQPLLDSIEEDDIAVSDPFSLGLPDSESDLPEMEPFLPEEEEVLPFDEPSAAGSESSFMDPEIIEIFYEEAEEHFETINRNLEVLERDVTGTTALGDEGREMIRHIRRAVHTIKGASGLVGMKALAAWAHSVEDLLDWLFDEALEIDPVVVSVLLKSADILELHVSDQASVSRDEMEGLRKEFSRIIGTSGGAVAETVPVEEIPLYTEASVGIFDTLPVEEEAREKEERSFGPILPQASGTFRVGMEKLDELVNLASEQIIALSAFDQKLDLFLNTVSELDLYRERLRETSRDLELGYEVRAIQKPGMAVAAGGAGSGDSFSDFDNLELDRYSEFNLFIRALAESVVDIGEIHSRMQNFHSDFDGYITRQRVLLSELQGKMMNIRMAPMSVITTRMRRAVREVADKLGKKIRLTIRGEGIELDRVIWEKLADPLLHILRNAADHGIEDPRVRKETGKVETGVIAVSASREGNQVIIRIRDDGAGLNFNAIRSKAEGLRGADAVAVMSDDELTDLIFTPGFSTRSDVTEISGRGVGMDVVKTNIEELKGSVRISSPEAGNGTVITVRIPLTLAVIRAIICTAGGRTFAVPLNEISDILRVSPENMIHEPMESLRVGDEIFPLYHLSRVLGISEVAQAQAEGDERPIVLKIESLERSAGFAVDSLLGQREIVIKSLGSHLQYVKGISGATVMGDGSVVPILNVSELLSGETGKNRKVASEVESEKEKPLEILIVDDSVSVRQVVTRLMEDQGWKTTSARDGMEALEKLPAINPDLIILDVEMPRMNGYEFLAARRSNPVYRNIPVVMLTSRSTVKYREKARELGADGYVVKPFNDREFLNLIHSLTVK